MPAHIKNRDKVIQELPSLSVHMLKSLSTKLRDSDSLRIFELEDSNRLLAESNRELAGLNAFLDEVIDQTPSALFLVTAEGDIFRMGKVAANMFGIPITGDNRKINSLFVNFRLSEHILKINETWSGEVTGKRYDQEFPVYLSITALTGYENKMVHFLICQDISDLQRLNRTITDYEKFVSVQQTAVEMAYGINDILESLIKNMGKVVSKLSDELKKELGKPIQSIEDISQLVFEFAENFMLYRSTKNVFSFVDLRATTRLIVKYCQSQGKFNNIDITYITAPDFPTKILIEESQIQSVVINLLNNAAEALNKLESKKKKKIRVELLKPNEESFAIIKITDNGPGFDIKQLSQPSVDRYKDRPNEHEIGLVTMKKIIESHGGKLQVDSQPSEGTTFQIWLPLRLDTKDVDGVRAQAE